MQTGHSTLRRFLVVAAVAILIAVLPFISGLVGAVILHIVVHPAYAHLARRWPKRLAAFACAAGALVLLLVPGGWLIATVVSEGSDALRALDPNAVTEWLAHTRFGNLEASRAVGSVSSAALGWLSARAVGFVGSATGIMLNTVIAFFGLYYLLLDGDSAWHRLRALLPVPDTMMDAVVIRFVDVTKALLLGTVLTAALQGTIVGLGFAIVGLEPAILWGFVTACVSVLPLFGSALVWGPGVIILFASHRPGAAIVLLILGAGVASNLDNLVRPIVYRRVSGIHPMLTIVGAFAGVHLVGIMGALLGPLLLSYFVELLSVCERPALSAT